MRSGSVDKHMLIEEMTRDACLDFLRRHRLGRLACACDGQPYITPFYFAVDDSYLYAFGTLGRKIQWMRANPLVCVEVDIIETSERWSSVVVMGRYEELAAGSPYERFRHQAFSLLQQHPVWWEPGFGRMQKAEGEDRALEPLYYRIRIDEISGHVASP